MKFNVFPNYRIPIEHIYYDEHGEIHVEHVGWIETPDIQVLKDDHLKHVEMVQK